MMKRSALFLSVLLGTCLVSLSIAHACKIPVFRYALERWPADNYSMVAIVNGEPSESVQAALRELEAIDRRRVNVNVEVIDLAKLTEAELWSVEGLANTDDAPMLQVFYPENDAKQRQICWTGDLTTCNIRRWQSSPVREQIVAELGSGASAVWVVIEGPDPSENNQFHSRLNQALAKAESQLSIPAGVIKRQDAARVLQEDPSASMDDVLRCDIPLQVKFATVVLRNDDPNELALQAMADGIAGDARPPFAIPIFGRGRMIEPLSQSKFSEASVVSVCSYLFEECSCSVKSLNPGIDVMIAANWQQLLGDHVVIAESIAITDPQLLAIPSGGDADAANTSRIGYAKTATILAVLFAVCVALFAALKQTAT